MTTTEKSYYLNSERVDLATFLGDNDFGADETAKAVALPDGQRMVFGGGAAVAFVLEARQAGHFYLRHTDGRYDETTAGWYAGIDDARIDRAVAMDKGAKAADLVVVDSDGQGVTGDDPILISHCMDCDELLWVYASEVMRVIDRNDAPHTLLDEEDRCRECANAYVPDDGPPEWMFDEYRESNR